MSLLLKAVLAFIIIYFIYNWFSKTLAPAPKPEKEKDVKVFKTKEVEKSKYNVEAETVEYEEIKENET